MTSSSSASPCCSTFRITAPLSFMARNSFTSVIRRFPLLVVSLIPLLFMTMTINNMNKVDGAVSSNVLASCPVLDCATNDNKNKTFFPVHVASDIAQFWDSFYGYNFKIINVTNTGEQYVLYQCGTEKPSVGPVTVQSADYQKDGGIFEHTQTVEILPNAKFFSIPLKKVCVLETVVMTFMELLGVRTAIYKTANTFTASACINQLVKDGTTKALSYPYTAEQLADCDAVINYGNKASPDPKTITFQSTSDPGALNRAEYLDYISLFFNKEAASNSVFIPIQNRYNALAEKAKAKSNKKKAAWINSYQGYYFDKAAYKLDLMTNAGLDVYLPPAGSASSFKTPGELFDVLRENNVEVLIDEAYALKDYNAFLTYYGINGTADAVPETSRYLFIKNKMILRDDGLKGKNDAHDWFESAIPNMDAVLTDIVYRVYPDLVPAGYSRLWFRNIALGEEAVYTLDTCTDVNSASLPRLDENPGPAGFKCPDWLMNPSLYVPPAPSAAFHQYALNVFIVAAIIIGSMMQLFFH